MAVQQPQILLLLVTDIRIQQLDKISTTTVEQDGNKTNPSFLLLR